jgi:hypothetical protein
VYTYEEEKKPNLVVKLYSVCHYQNSTLPVKVKKIAISATTAELRVHFIFLNQVQIHPLRADRIWLGLATIGQVNVFNQPKITIF